MERASCSTKSDLLRTDPNTCRENLKPCWEEIQTQVHSRGILLFFFFLTFALKSGLGSLERSRTPLHALYASGGPEATDAEERT